MTGGGWVILIVSAAAQVAVMALLGWAMWDGFTAEQRLWAVNLLQSAAGLPFLALVANAGILCLALVITFTRWVKPLRNRRGGAADRDDQSQTSGAGQRRLGSPRCRFRR